MAEARHRKTDAELILAVLDATADWEGATNLSAVVKPLRELIWAVWEQPRLPQPRYRGKYPLTVPWSEPARKVYDARSAERLVLEHVTPASVVVRDLLRRRPASPAMLIRTLNRRLSYVVLTPAENRRFLDARVAAKLAPGSKDPWDRYRAAGIDPASLRPVLEG